MRCKCNDSTTPPADKTIVNENANKDSKYSILKGLDRRDCRESHWLGVLHPLMLQTLMKREFIIMIWITPLILNE